MASVSLSYNMLPVEASNKLLVPSCPDDGILQLLNTFIFQVCVTSALQLDEVTTIALIWHLCLHLNEDCTRTKGTLMFCIDIT